MSDAIDKLQALGRLVRYYSLAATTEAGSGHPTSALSAADLMVGLLFGGSFRYDVDEPGAPNNDRLLFSKGHASPLFYSLWLAAGKLTEQQMMSYGQFGSPLEGHPTMNFPYTVASAGSLGQGLSIGVGLAVNAKYLEKLPYRTYVLLGDSELSEGSQWEAMQIAAHCGLGNLVGIVNVNRPGQRGATMYGRDLGACRERIAASGWRTLLVDGHDYREILDAYEAAARPSEQPTMIIARTVDGKGVPFLESREALHDTALSFKYLSEAFKRLGEIEKTLRGQIPKPAKRPRPEPRPGAAEVALDAEVGFRGNKVLRRNDQDAAAVIAAGATVHEALAAADQLKREHIPVRVIDLYCIKPIDADALGRALGGTAFAVTVEDHYAAGGLGEAVRSALAAVDLPILSLAVRRQPCSGEPEEPRDYEGIGRDAIVKLIKESIGRQPWRASL